MKSISPESFAMICFLILMQNSKGVIDKSPDYITEKIWMLKDGITAFGALDIYNMRKVKEWCDVWNIEMPREAAEYLSVSEIALNELKTKGLEI